MKLPIPVALGQRRSKFYLLLVLLALGLAFGAYRYWHRLPHYQGVSPLQVDLRHPEMLLATRNLADLPKAIAATPVLAGLVDEELVFHYEEDEARLSIEGTLRRLAYEHDLDLADHFLASLLAAPAEIGLWRSGKGRPEHFVAKLERGTLGKLAEALARIAGDDRQLKQAGKFSLAGDEVTLYTLDYGAGRTLAFAGRGENWVFLSDPRLALDEEGQLSGDAEAVLGDLLDGGHPWQASLPYAKSAQHSLVIGKAAFALDYGHFLPALAGLRLDHENGSWRAALRLDTKYLPGGHDTAAIWRALPLGAAFCSALPVDWSAARAPLAALLGNDAASEPTLAALDPIAAVCWYADSRLAAPLFVARSGKELPPGAGPLLAQLAEKAWSAKAEPVASQDDKNPIYVATVASRHGLRQESGSERAFPVALARHRELIFFSPDRRLVDAALAVAAKRAAALGDEPGLAGAGWLVVDPALVARLLRAEVQEVLPADEESFFREVARSRLWPRLEAWGKQQTAAVAVPGPADGDGFLALEFKALKGSGR
ncbi:MAG: hypothetical protein H6R15_847 [Proteobacteria bacterium]|nr:hypothetical protein [Pseudomonadota bacterium]